MRTGVTAWSSVGLRESTYSAGPAYRTEQRSSAAQQQGTARRAPHLQVAQLRRHAAVDHHLVEHHKLLGAAAASSSSPSPC